MTLLPVNSLPFCQFKSELKNLFVGRHQVSSNFRNLQRTERVFATAQNVALDFFGWNKQLIWFSIWRDLFNCKTIGLSCKTSGCNSKTSGCNSKTSGCNSKISNCNCKQILSKQSWSLQHPKMSISLAEKKIYFDFLL